MTRTAAREIAVHMVYQLGFASRSAQEVLEEELTPERFALLGEEQPIYRGFPEQDQQDYIRALVEGVFLHWQELDALIARYAVGWSVARLPRTAAAVLRVAMFELLYMPDVPPAAAINEAVEIAKGYEPPEVVSFLNGVLGTFVRQEDPRGARGAAPEEGAGEAEPAPQAPEGSPE